MTVYEELLKAAEKVQFKPQSVGQGPEEHLSALVRAISKVDDDTWRELSIPCQGWFNEAAAAVNAVQPIPECEGFKDINKDKAAVAAARPQQPVEPVATEQPHPHPAISVPVGKVTAPQLKPVSRPKVEAPKEKTVSDAIRSEIIIHPSWNLGQLRRQLILQGWPEDKVSESKINIYMSDILKTIAIAKKFGLWNDEVASSFDVPPPTEETSVAKA